MPNKIKLKKSSVPLKAPEINDLDYGEIAINYADGRLYFKNTNNEISYFSSANPEGTVSFTNNTSSTSTTTGALVVTGGVGIGENLWVGGYINVDNLRLQDNTLSSTNSDGNIVLAPNGAGDVYLDTDTVRIGDINTAAIITTNGTGNLILRTGSANSGVITINQGNNANIEIQPHGTGDLIVNELGGDVDVRMEGDTDANLFYLDASTDRIGVGTSAPGSKLAVAGSITELYNSIYWNVVTQVDIGTDANQVPLNQYLGQLAFVDEYSPSTMRREGAGSNDVSIDSNGTVTVSSGVGSTSTSTGSLVVTGGLGLSENLYVGGLLQVDNLRLQDNTLSSTNTNGSIIISPNGTGGVIINESGNNVDVRIEGDTDTDLFFTDASADSIGIGTNAPGEKLDIRGNLRIGGQDAGPNYIAFRGTTGDSPGSYNHTYIGERIFSGTESSELVIFKGNDGPTTAGPDRIRLIGADLVFDTYTSATSGTFEQIATSVNVTTKAILKADGKFGIGTDSPGALLDVRGPVIFNEDGGNNDVRIEGDTDTNLFFTDASTDRIGIGNNSPQNKLHVQQSASTTNAVIDVLRLDYQSTGTPANGIGVGIEFAVETTVNNTEVGAAIEAVVTDVTAGSEDFDVVFRTMIAGATAAQVGKLNRNTLQVGANNTNTVITTQGTSDLTLNTNGGSNSSSIAIEDAANGNINIELNGTGELNVTGTVDVKSSIKLTSPDGANVISLNMYDEDYLSFDGNVGQLFSISDSLTGTIFSVNDISGMPSIEVLDTGIIKLAEYSGSVLIGTPTDDGTNLLQVNGSVRANTFVSTVGTGTAPFTVASTTLVTNLNADLLDGKNIGTSGSAIPLLDGTNSWSANNTFTNVDVSGTLRLTSGSVGNALDLGNNGISGVNAIYFNDPGPNEGLEWTGGNGWKIYESPDNLTTNSGGNLQIVQGTTRRATFNTAGQLDIPVSTGTAPFLVSSTTRVSNLNVATAGTADTWTTSRTITIGSTGKSVNGSSNVSWSLGEIGAQAAGNYVTTDTTQTVTAQKTFSGLVNFTNNGTQFLLKSGSTSNPTVIHRADGSNYYILLSDAGTTPNETWNSLRPLVISQTSGLLSSSNGQDFRGGTVFNEDSADVDFRVESNNNGNMLFVDGGTDRVGIGTGTPSNTLSVAGTVGISESGSTGNRLLISTSGSGAIINQNDNSPISLQIQSNTAIRIDSNGTVAVGYNSVQSYKLAVNGSFAATTKSFVIDHPTKPGMKLRYGSLEGPENGVYVRGKLNGDNVIELPEYWTKLVDPESITVQLTPIGKHQKLFVEDIRDNKVIVGNDSMFSSINCFYVVFGERMDVEKLKVEIDDN